MTPLQPAPLDPRELGVQLAALAFTTVEDDPDIVARVREQPAQLFIPVQTSAGNDEDEHAAKLQVSAAPVNREGRRPGAGAASGAGRS